MIAVLDQIRRGERVDHYETMRRRKDGTEIAVSLTVSPMRSSSGEIIGASKIARDISARRQTEKAMRIAENLAAVGRLATSIAHDINNPLAAATNLLFLLENENLSEEGKHYLATAQRELSRIAHITAQALGFYRSRGELVWLSIATILDDALVLHHDRCSALGIEVSRDYDSAPQIFCRPGELRQVMVNLVGNALDAMPSGGSLQLRIRRTTDWIKGGRALCIAVADTGGGMSAETRHRLFEPFYTTKQGTRSGLGLWICADIVGKYKGRISMRSNDVPGRNGSVFMLVLPV
jgi:signal transduction histidine kinase